MKWYICEYFINLILVQEQIRYPAYIKFVEVELQFMNVTKNHFSSVFKHYFLISIISQNDGISKLNCNVNKIEYQTSKLNYKLQK